MSTDEIKTMVQIAKMYYLDDMKQDMIAAQLSLSKSKVCRIISKAKEMGIVQVQIVDPLSSIEEKKRALIEKFGLKNCEIVQFNKVNYKKDTARKTAQFLASILKDGDVIGLSYGTTLAFMMDEFPKVNVKNVEIVQIKGMVAKKNVGDINHSVAERLAQSLKAGLSYLTVPVIVDSKEAKESFLREATIKQVVDMGKAANIALFSIGYPDKDSIISRYGYLTDEELEKMRIGGVAGDICSRFFNIDGSIYDEALNERTTSIELADLRNKEYSIGICAGEYAFYGALGAIRGGYINCLVTDELTADRLIMEG